MAIDGALIPIALFVCGAVTAIGVPLAKAYARRLDREPRQPTLPSELVERLDRMEQAIDSIAIEVERVSEGQRFTTKLLSERNNSTPPSVPERQT
jgi:hypothetical protein